MQLKACWREGLRMLVFNNLFQPHCGNEILMNWVNTKGFRQFQIPLPFIEGDSCQWASIPVDAQLYVIIWLIIGNSDCFDSSRTNYCVQGTAVDWHCKTPPNPIITLALILGIWSRLFEVWSVSAILSLKFQPFCICIVAVYPVHRYYQQLATVIQFSGN